MSNTTITSRPTRARGLKLVIDYILKPVSESRPTRARGLKHLLAVCLSLPALVAPHAGAWIETFFINALKLNHPNVAPHAGAWIETIKDLLSAIDIISRAPRGRVD